MMDYPFCDRTVTVYRLDRGQVQRLVVENCYYFWEQKQVTDLYGTRQDTKFLLVMPGSCQRVFVGDRIYDGIGPEEVDWREFIPVNVPGLSQAAYVRPCWWGGTVCHVEAGRKE